MILITVIADRVGVPDEIEPVAGQAFAKLRGNEQFIDQRRITFG